MVEIIDQVLYRKKLLKERGDEIDSTIKRVVEKSGVSKAFDKAEKSEITMLSYFIVILAITGDILGLIPFVGNFLGLVFGVILVVLYFFNGLGRGVLLRRNVRRWVLRGVLYGIEFLAFGFSWIPLFTFEALIDFSLSKRGYYKKIEKVKEAVDKIK